ncbi:hypothetical protein ABE10_25475, partial [Bacillus toyonensis]|nr:hypothetical protein [Bacillus toyonensis]
PSAATAPPDGRPADRMPRSPSRALQGLRTLRHRAPTSRPMGRGSPLRRADHRAGAGRRGGVG